MTLEDKFPEWYSRVVPNFTQPQIAARITAIKALNQGLKKQSIPQLVRMFYALPISDLFTQEVRQALRTADPQYVSQDQAELAIVAGGVIFFSTATPSEEADAVGLAVCCAEAIGLRKSKRLDDVVHRCKQYLVDEGVRVRDEAVTIPEFPEKNLATIISKVKEKQSDLPSFSQAVEEQLLKINAAMKTYVQLLGDLITKMELRRKEESNILYWLLGEATLEDHSAYSTFSSDKDASIAAAHDLASLTEDLPGPPGTRAFLRRILTFAGYKEPSTASISDVVTALDARMRDRYAPSSPVSDPCMTPICFAIQKAKESGGGTDWSAAFKTQTLLDPKKKVAVIDLSELFYSELLLLRALA